MGRKAFALESYFESIELFKKGLTVVRERWGKDDHDEALLAALSALFDEDQEFLTYITVETNYSIQGADGPVAWKTACDALAWTLLQEYDKAVEEKRWPTN